MNAPTTGAVPPVAAPADPLDTDRVRRARARLAEEPGSEKGPTGREDIEAANAADPRGLEWSHLRAIYEQIDRRANNRIFELKARLQAEAAQAQADHARAKPARWAALSSTERLLYWVAALDECPDALSRLITRKVLPLLARDLSKETPPETFEPEHWS